MCSGPLFQNILLYALPLMASGVLQLVYNMADSIVVAKFAGGTALAAVGSTGSLSNLIINIAIGLSVGASVTVARYYGAGDREAVDQTVHTVISLALIAGVVTLLTGLLISRQALIWMGTPDEVLDQASLYMKLYFIGMPANMLYNYASAILRAIGDTRRPLYILILSGLVNVGLNLFLVIVFHWDVAGVATATVISQVVSAVLTLRCLLTSDDCYRLDFKRLHIDKEKLIPVLRQGIPAGIQGSIFSLSNIVIQSSVNSFGVAAMSGSAAASNIEGIAFTAMNSLHHTCLAFTGQNLGAGNPKRMIKAQRLCAVTVAVIGIVLGNGIFLFGRQALQLYTAASSTASTVSNAEILEYGIRRMKIVITTYFLCGVMDVFTGALRGMGQSMMPMIVSIAGVCGVRMLWIFTVFKNLSHTYETVFLSYPISWAITGAFHFCCLLILRKRLTRENKRQNLLG